jgi:DUF1016 N-terminal domain
MVEAYWNIGRLIVEEEQKGKRRADYSTYLITELSLRLSKDFGKGFDASNLRNMRIFYVTFPISDALRHKSKKNELAVNQTVSSELPESRNPFSGMVNIPKLNNLVLYPLL